jgi:NADH:ubiquinone oxidoreductase subunit 4 (subunit M)
MRNIRKVFFSPMPAEIEKHHVGDVTALDKVAITTLCFFMIIIGSFPAVMTPMISSGVQNILRLLGGA